MRRTLFWLLCLPVWAQMPADATLEAQATRLRALMVEAARLPLERTEFVPQAPRAGDCILLPNPSTSTGRAEFQLLPRVRRDKNTYWSIDFKLQQRAGYVRHSGSPC